MELSDFLLKLLVNILCAAYESDTAHSETVCIYGFLGAGPYPWVIRQTEVVIPTEIVHFLTALNHNFRALRARNDSLNLVSACLLDGSYGLSAYFSQFFNKSYLLLKLLTLRVETFGGSCQHIILYVWLIKL